MKSEVRKNSRKKNTVHWFRKGLRLSDNPALLRGIRRCETFRCIFILDPWFAGSSNVGTNKWRWLQAWLLSIVLAYITHGTDIEVNRSSWWLLNDLVQVSTAIPRGSWQQPSQTEQPPVRDKRSASRRSTNTVQRMGNYILHLRGGPRAIRPGPRSEYCGDVQRNEHCCGSWTLTHSLQSWQVILPHVMTWTKYFHWFSGL